MNLPAFLNDPVFLAIGFIILGAFGGTVGRLLVEQSMRKGKIWLVGLNSNNKTGSVRRVSADREGYQVPNGPYVKFEGNYAYIDRKEQRPIFAFNEDTGKCIRATEGESQEMDGSMYAAFSANKDIERLNLAGSGINWGMIAAIAAGLALVGLCIIGYMITKLAPSGAH